MHSFSQSQITEEEHRIWFQSKIESESTEYFILVDSLNNDLGSARVDINQDGNGIISYLIDPYFHGRKLGKTILTLLEEFITKQKLEISKLTGYVLETNIPSVKIFESLGYSKYRESESLRFIKQLP